MSLSEDQLLKIERVLDRQVPLQAIEQLSDAIGARAKSEYALEDIAIGWDANVFLKLSGNKKRADVIDYFASRHKAPFILPGQVVQEFWNNQFTAIQSVATNFKKHFDALSSEALKIDSAFGEFADQATSLIARLGAEYGYLRDKATTGHLNSICEMLSSTARTVYLPRLRFHPYAVQRKRTKTPPGFKDDGDGDFFVWADFLGGLLVEQELGKTFQHVVLVTDDRKPDWSTAGITHPILSAEVNALIGTTFEVWSLERLVDRVVLAVADNTSAPIATDAGVQIDGDAENTTKENGK